MARPISVTKEKIVAAALEIVRKDGSAALTSRNLCTAIGCGANAVFTAFGSINGVKEAVREEARKMYQERVGAGLSLNPPFKGLGIAFMWFAIDEPHLYKLIMENPSGAPSFDEYIDTHVGFREEGMASIKQSFGLQGKDAEMIYYQLLLVALGLAQTCVEGGAQLSITQASEIFGKTMRAFLMIVRANSNPMEAFMPQKGPGPDVDVESYLMIKPLAGQNHLLQELHASPRFIKDDEWAELERVLRNTTSITLESLKEKYPGLTTGDLRAFILDRLHFPVTEQAILMGISPASVTKARQRLKNKVKD